VRGVVLDPAGNVTRDCGTGELVTLTRTDQIVEVQLAGGAGFGDPRARSAAMVEQDVAEGVVSPESARRDYGWQAAAGRAAE
jgi:5-oxoprolinase (ATP-hydrolysing)/N-methylhydantoinase A